MDKHGRLTAVTLKALVEQGYRQFGWLNPAEQFGGELVTTIAPYQHGAFVYQMEDGHMPLIFTLAMTQAEQEVAFRAMAEWKKQHVNDEEGAEVREARKAMIGAFKGLRSGWSTALTSVLKEFEIEKRNQGAFDAHNTLLCGSTVLTNIVIYMGTMPTGQLVFALFWLYFAPIFYTRVFMPCYECYDFSAMVAHEVGHLLGFDHPDKKPEMNLRSTVSPTTNVTCRDPLAFAELAVHPTEIGEQPKSIMFSSTLRRSITCLTQDDLEGLDALYPDCDAAAREPVCYGEQSSSGWLRLFFAVAVPFVITLVVVLVPICLVRAYQRRHVSALEKQVRGLKARSAWGRANAAVRGTVLDETAKKRARADRLLAAMHQARLEAAKAEGRAAKMELEAARLSVAAAEPKKPAAKKAKAKPKPKPAASTPPASACPPPNGTPPKPQPQKAGNMRMDQMAQMMRDEGQFDA